jgi:uncharacterized membrane protein
MRGSPYALLAFVLAIVVFAVYRLAMGAPPIPVLRFVFAVLIVSFGCFIVLRAERFVVDSPGGEQAEPS